MVVDQVGMPRTQAELGQGVAGKPGRSQIQVKPRTLHPVATHLHPLRQRIGTQGQYLAFDALGATTLSQLEDDLLDTAHGFRVVGFEKM
jgi:hypothetical protein